VERNDLNKNYIAPMLNFWFAILLNLKVLVVYIYSKVI